MAPISISTGCIAAGLSPFETNIVYSRPRAEIRSLLHFQVLRSPTSCLTAESAIFFTFLVSVSTIWQDSRKALLGALKCAARKLAPVAQSIKTLVG
jgi:hypothetical protein